MRAVIKYIGHTLLNNLVAHLHTFGITNYSYGDDHIDIRKIAKEEVHKLYSIGEQFKVEIQLLPDVTFNCIIRLETVKGTIEHNVRLTEETYQNICTYLNSIRND